MAKILAIVAIATDVYVRASNCIRHSPILLYLSFEICRQDAIVVQLIRIINEIWLSKQLDLRIMIYKVLPTGLDRGIIELVPRCSTLREIQVQIEGIRGVYSVQLCKSCL